MSIGLMSIVAILVLQLVVGGLLIPLIRG